MRWLVAIAVLVLVARRIGTERIADLVRWADQRLELFSPRGAGLYARFAVPLLGPLYRRVADEVAALAPDTVLDVGTGPGALAIEIAKHGMRPPARPPSTPSSATSRRTRTAGSPARRPARCAMGAARGKSVPDRGETAAWVAATALATRSLTTRR